MKDVLDDLEQEYEALLRRALRHAASTITGVEDQQLAVGLSFVPVVDRRPPAPSRHVHTLLSAAAALVVIVVAAIVVTQGRHHSNPGHTATVVAPGWTLSDVAPIHNRAGGVFLSADRDVLVWGGTPYVDDRTVGGSVRDGALYDRDSNRWRAVADAPIAARVSARSLWTGSVALIWGGLDDAGNPLGDGAILDPLTLDWHVMASAPAGVSGASAVVWTGKEMVVWGGPEGSKGAAFDPATNRWRVLPDAPIVSRVLDSAVWTGSEMIVWSDGQGAAFNPVINAWRATSPSPLRPAEPIGVWIGSEVIFLGGATTDAGLTEAVAYQPTADTWRPLASGPAHPGLRFDWTGSTILAVVKGVVLQYDTITNRWSETKAEIPARAFGAWTGDSYVFNTGASATELRVGAFDPAATTDTSPLAAYELTLPSARLTNDETGVALDTDSAVWSHDDGTYLTLTVRTHFTSAPTGVGATSPVSPFPAARGQAWYGETETPTGVSDSTSVSSLLWWQRPNGDLWLMHAYWYGAVPPPSAADRQQRLVQWALDVKNPGNGSYDLGDNGISSVAHEGAGERRTRTQIWNLDNHQIVLLVIEDSATVGLSNALAFGKPQRIYVDSRRGWSSTKTTNPTNDVTVSWSVSDLTNDWAMLTIPAALADRANEIISDIHLAA